MTSLQQRQLDFLNDTIKFYGEDPSRRAATPNGCKYRTEDNKGCAIGRHLNDELAKKLDNATGPAVFKKEIFDSLPENLRALTQEFLIVIQQLHDSRRNWGTTGLSDIGEKEVTHIKHNIETNCYNE